jgi:FlaA1/EpsC-like NDP-sugar epimerase
MNKWSFTKILIDTSVWTLSGIIAFMLRYEYSLFDIPPSQLWTISIALPIKFFLVYALGHHLASWRYSDISDLKRPLLSISIFTLLYLSAAVLFRNIVVIPLSVPIIEFLLTAVGLFMVRLSARYVLRDRRIQQRKNLTQNSDFKRALIIGAGEAGTLIAKEMDHLKDMKMKPIGYLDDDPIKLGQYIQGLKVLGAIDDLESIIVQYKISQIIIALPSEAGPLIRKIVHQAQKSSVPFLIIPRIFDLINGKFEVKSLRKVQVEDLLRRKPVELENDRINSYIKDKIVLITGAGGSIGSEIVRQIIRFNPAHIILLGRGENSIFEIMRECQSLYPHIKTSAKICNVRDKPSLKNIFNSLKPEVVFHAAAHKHVHLMEENPEQAILNNVGGTFNLTNLALEFGVKYFVNVSSDKAVNPTSVMGASKLLAEYIVQNAAAQASENQFFVSVRFGNVLGSRGSVVPIFQEQIKNGGPVTVTDPLMKRYFMTIPEASQLVLQAGALQINGAVFVLNMGEPVLILDIARDLIRLSGLEPDEDIKIVFTGAKKGEKLFEELLTQEEESSLTRHTSITIAKMNGLPDNFEETLQNLLHYSSSLDKEKLRKLIFEALRKNKKQSSPKLPSKIPSNIVPIFMDLRR